MTREDYDRALKINPEYAKAYGNRGLAWKELGEKEKARADWEKAVELFEAQGRQQEYADIVQGWLEDLK